MKPTKIQSTQFISEWIWQQETAHQLLECQDQGIHYWRLIRFPLWLALHEKTGFMDEPHPRRSIQKRLLSLLRIPKAVLCNNPQFMHRPVKTIVLPHSRLVDGVEMHSRPVVKNLNPQDTLLLYHDWNGSQLSGSKNLTASFLFGLVKRKLLRHKIYPKSYLSEATQTALAQVEHSLLDTFGLRIDLCAMATTQMVAFQRNREIYYRLFRRLQAQELYIVVGYATKHMAAIDAAHACGMRTTEIQHGSYTVHQPAYGFPNYSKDVPYSPQRFLSLGNFWIETTALPRNIQTQIIGAAHLHQRIADFSGTAKIPKSILFISQGTVGVKLCQTAIECADRLPDYRITFRLHPSESIENYEKWFTAGKRPANFSFSQGGASTLTLLAEAETVAGVYSTALYEGMLLGCKTILLDLPGIEHMQAVLERGDALLAADAADFCTKIGGAPTCATPYDYYAPPKEILQN